MGFKTIRKVNDLLASYVNLKIRLARVLFDIRNSRFTNEELDRIIYECERSRKTNAGPDGEWGDSPLQAAEYLDAQHKLNQYWHDLIFHPCDADT